MNNLRNRSGNSINEALSTDLGVALPADRQHPASIGRYRIIRLLGEGGMGAVYESEQDNPRRLVALKMIRTALASPEMLRRFEQESRALGLLHHPGIAQIYEAGSVDAGFGAQPFIAMELVYGKPLTEYADEKKLNTRQRLELMVHLCEAVEHAHRHGIIHRDLKPGNILVDERGQPKILDFGLAHATDIDEQATRQTDMGQLLGTLAYMSPEQVLGNPLAVDTRSDVYALGVILYELLAGKMPYTLPRQLHEAVRTIQYTEPAPLSSVSKNYRGDIETLVAKSLDKDKQRRYPSVSDLAADIGRYLHEEPILARPSSFTYQLQKFCRRNRVFVMALAAIFVVLTAGVIVSTTLAFKARRAQREAEKQTAIAKAVNNFLRNDLLLQGSAYQQSDPNITVRTALERAVQRIDGKFINQPEVEIGLRRTIGGTLGDIGSYKQEEKQLSLALQMSQRLLGPDDPRNDSLVNDVIQAEGDVENYSEAERLAADALERLQRRRKSDRVAIGRIQDRLSLIYANESKFAQAEAMGEQAFEGLQRTLGLENKDTMSAMSTVSVVFGLEGKAAEAEVITRQLLGVRTRTLGPNSPNTLQTMSNLASDLTLEDKLADAEKLHRECLEARRRVLGPEHPDTLDSLGNLGVTLMSEQKYEEAMPLLVEDLNLRTKALGPKSSISVEARVNLAELYNDMGDSLQSLALLEPALQSGAYDATVESEIAWIELTVRPVALRRPHEALNLAQKAHDLNPENPVILNSLGFAQIQNGLLDRAAATLKESLRQEKTPTADTLFLLSIADQRRRAFSSAESEYSNGVEVANKQDQVDSDTEVAWREAAKALRKPAPKLHLQ